jgi:hypothetical protein
MNLLCLLSDQLLMWSALHVGYFFCATQASQAITERIARSRESLAWFTHRTLQTLRQAGLQMRQWSRPWSEVLPFRQFPRRSTANGLCAARRLRRRCGAISQLSSSPRNHRRNLRDQSRIVAAPRGAVGLDGEPSCTIAHYSHRFTARRRSAGQYAHHVARRRVASDRGGHR